MKHTFSKAAPTGRLEYDHRGFPLAPIEYQDHDCPRQQARAIGFAIGNNTDRLKTITDYIIQLITRIK